VCTGSFACLEQARSSRAFERALRTRIVPDAVSRLAEHLGWEEGGGSSGLVSPVGGARG
jgi:hypothetical protein